jgi:hypothetical protein
MNDLTLFDNLLDASIGIYHNTTSLSGNDLKEHQFRAGKLNKRVLDFFRSHSYENYTPWETYKALGINSCIKSSVQRSMTDLTTMGYLIKLDGFVGRPKVQRPGEWKELCYARQIK